MCGLGAHISIRIYGLVQQVNPCNNNTDLVGKTKVSTFNGQQYILPTNSIRL